MVFIMRCLNLLKVTGVSFQKVNMSPSMMLSRCLARSFAGDPILLRLTLPYTTGGSRKLPVTSLSLMNTPRICVALSNCDFCGISTNKFVKLKRKAGAEALHTTCDKIVYCDKPKLLKQVYTSNSSSNSSFKTYPVVGGLGCDKRSRLDIQKTKKKAAAVKETVEETVREWKEDIVFTIPNALTATRILLTPVLGYMVVNEFYSWSCALFVFAGITDLLDGYIARNYPGQASAFGSYLDPLADKFLVSVLFLSLSAVDLIPVPLTVLVILRDVFLISAAFYVRYSTLPPPKTLKRYFDVTHATAQLHPTFISKLNTAVQLTLVATSLAAPVFGYVDHAAMHALWYLTAGTTIASGITYMFAKDTVSILSQTRKKRAKQL